MDDDGYYARPYYYNELAKGAKGSAKGDAAQRKLRGTRRGKGTHKKAAAKCKDSDVSAKGSDAKGNVSAKGQGCG